ncbi:MAG: hypothetical protein ACREF1_10455, partial [Acetobacteraceae bacterium]
DHLREQVRQSADDRASLARAAAFQATEHSPARFIAIDPAHAPAGMAAADPAQQPVIGWPPAIAAPYRARTEQGMG